MKTAESKLQAGALIGAGAVIRVGTASWSDPGFVADWYPKKLPASERLAWYAQFFGLVELNSSFYGVPDQRSIQRWCEQTPKGFLFDVKMHKLLSRHSVKPEMLPPDLRRIVTLRKGTVVLTPQLEEAVAKRFLEEIEPLREAKKLGALLLQLTPGFSPRSHKLHELDSLIAQCKGYKLAIELRNRNWVLGEQLAATEEFFTKRDVTYVMVDAPEDPHFTVMPAVDLVTTPKLGYLRAHGRNVKGYITGRTVAERFNHQYTDKELDEIQGRVEKLSNQVKEFHVVYNNNASDYAPRAAIAFKERLK